MALNNLIKIKSKSKKRLGQGHGSGRVKTSGRGTKGEKARGKVALSFEGGALPLIKRLPFLRGKGRNFPKKPKPEIVSVLKLSVFKDGDIVDLKKLIEKKLVDAKKVALNGVKIIGKGKLDKQLTVKILTSFGAKEVIEEAGGKVLNE